MIRPRDIFLPFIHLIDVCIFIMKQKFSIIRTMPLCAILLSTCFMLSCGSDDNGAAPAAARLLGLDVSTQTETQSYDQAFDLGMTTGAEFITLSLTWDLLEPTKGDYTTGSLMYLLDIANSYYPAKGTKVALGINPIDTVYKGLPAGMTSTDFDSAEVIAQYKLLLDIVFDHIKDLDLACLSIGNEVDIYLAAHPAELAKYHAFYEAAADYARSKRSGLTVGFKATHGGLTGASKTDMKTMNQHSDAVLATYYPLNADFTVKATTAVDADFDAIVAEYPGKTIYFLEAGYPGSATCGSSDDAQADFIVKVFSAWDRHAGSIGAVTFAWLTDLSETKAQEYVTYYGMSGDPNETRFKEYLRSLGLRTYPGAGADKKAFTTLKSEAAARGW